MCIRDRPIEETKETPTQSAETSVEKEQPIEETKETPTQSAETSEVTEEGKNTNAA